MVSSRHVKLKENIFGRRKRFTSYFGRLGREKRRRDGEKTRNAVTRERSGEDQNFLCKQSATFAAAKVRPMAEDPEAPAPPPPGLTAA